MNTTDKERGCNSVRGLSADSCFTRMNGGIGSTGASAVAEVSGSLLLASNNFYREVIEFIDLIVLKN